MTTMTCKREITETERAVETVLDTERSARVEYKLIHRSAGYLYIGTAGAEFKYVPEAWGCMFMLGGARNGRWCETEDKARDLMMAWVTAARVNDAVMAKIHAAADARMEAFKATLPALALKWVKAEGIRGAQDRAYRHKGTNRSELLAALNKWEG